MTYQIEWTTQALEDMQRLIGYLIEEWSHESANKFEAITLGGLQTLANEPFIGMISLPSNTVRSIVLSGHNKLYYRIKENTIIVLNIFDTGRILLKTGSNKRFLYPLAFPAMSFSFHQHKKDLPV